MKPKHSIGWTTIIRVMGGDRDAMRAALSKYRAAGYTPESFDANRKARELLCDCITAYEDMTEHKRGDVWARWRSETMAVRRRLELELWP